MNVQQAKTRLSELLARAERGDDIVIARAGVPAVRLVPVEALPPRQLGILELTVPKSFFEPLPESELAAWE